MTLVEAVLYTDPACPWSWALEPHLRRLVTELGPELRLRYVMVGLAREFADRDATVRAWLEAGLQSRMPVDPRIWWQSPLASSHPACIAVKAAAEQGDPGPYLRRLREGLMARRRKLDTVQALVEEAGAVAGLDLERFRIDLASTAMLEAFAADLERARSTGAALALPRVEFRGADGRVQAIDGARDYEALRAGAEAAGARWSTAPAPGLEEALRRWGTMATAEVAAVCRLPGPRAAAALWQAATEWRVAVAPAGTGELWTLT